MNRPCQLAALLIDAAIDLDLDLEPDEWQAGFTASLRPPKSPAGAEPVARKEPAARRPGLFLVR